MACENPAHLNTATHSLVAEPQLNRQPTYLVFLDGDDLLLPRALDTYAHVAKSREPTGTLRSFRGRLPETWLEDIPTEIRFVRHEILVKKDRSYRSCVSIALRREVFQRLKGWTEDVFPLEDLELLVKLSSNEAIQIVWPPATAYRMHEDNAVNKVEPFVREIRRMVGKIRRAEYPCTRFHRFASYAFIGGPALFWAKRALKCGLPAEALRLLASGWPMMLAAVLYKSRILLRGRQPVAMVSLQ